MIFLLAQKKQRSLLWFSRLFAVIGIVTVYFDFLTYPTLSLCIPLCMLLTALDDNNVWQKVKLTCASIASWFFGYAGMWAGKWLLCLLTNPGFLAEYVIPSIKFRSAESDYAWHFTRGQILKMRLGDCFFSPIGVTLFALLTGGLLCWLVLRCVKDRKFYFVQLLPYLLLMIVPFVWIMVLCNHSAVHWFSYRTFMTVIFAIPAALAAAAPRKAASDESISLAR